MQGLVEDRQIEFGEIDQLRVELSMLLSHAMKPFGDVRAARPGRVLQMMV